MEIAGRKKGAAGVQMNGRLGRGHGVASPPSLVDGGRGTRAGFVVNRASICAVILSAMLVVTGCGGGGSKPQPRVAVMPQVQVSPDDCIPLHDGTCPSEEDFNTAAEQLIDEYLLEDSFKNQWGLEAVGAHWAYAYVNLLKGENAGPGSGVTIGFIDSGIDQAHPMFAGKTITEVLLPGATDETGTRFSHGTAVASVAAGVHWPVYTAAPQGLAWGADIAMFAFTLGTGGGPYAPITLTNLAGRDASWAERFNQALAWRNGQKRVDILNLSIGLLGLIGDYSENDLRTNFGQAIAAMAQSGATDKAILVWAAGNAHGDPCDPSVMTNNCENDKVNAVSVEVLPGLAALIRELRGHSIAVVALKPDDSTIADFSNRCGIIAADFCIAAPGEDVRVAFFGPDPDPANPDPIRSVGLDAKGTSFAAPMVAGGLAIMKQLFRDQISNTELVTRLLETADDTGVYSDSSIYGRGKMDLAAAVHPVGVLEVPIGANTNQAGSNLGATRLSMGTPFGNGLARSVGNHEIMAVDDLGAPFWYRLGDFMAVANGPPMDARVRGFLASAPGFGGDAARPAGGASRWPQVEVRETPAETGGGHLSLAEGGVMVTFAGRSDLSTSIFATNREHDAMGGTLNWRPEESPVGLRVGWIGEGKTILGGEGRGAFGTLAADTTFLRVEGDAKLGAWRLGAGAEWGIVRPQVGGGIIDEVSLLTTSAFELHASTAVTDRNFVRFSLSQPLRVENGRASLTLPFARTKYGRVLRTSVASALEPGERQIDIAARWERPLASGQLRLGVIWSHYPGHRRSAEAQLTFLAGWRRAF